MTELLMLPCDLATLEKEGMLQMRISGNSGRTANMNKITPRRQVPEAVATEAASAAPYLQVCDQLGYNPDPAAPWPFLA